MPKLSREQIQFIDNYLTNSGVLYQDIRFEMTDHVASALEGLEGDFIENFKEYMVTHKAELLQSNKTFAINARTRAWNTLGKNLIKPVFLILFALITWGFISLTNSMEPDTALLIMRYVTGVIILAVFVHGFINFITKGKGRYSVADKLLSSVCIVFYMFIMILKPEKLLENSTALCVYYALEITVLGAVYYTYIALIKKYRAQFIK